MKKRIVSLLLTVAMVFSLTSIIAFADGDEATVSYTVVYKYQNTDIAEPKVVENVLESEVNEVPLDIEGYDWVSMQVATATDIYNNIITFTYDKYIDYTVQYIKRSDNTRLAPDKNVTHVFSREVSETPLYFEGYLVDVQGYYQLDCSKINADGVMVFYYDEYTQYEVGDIIKPGDWIGFATPDPGNIAIRYSAETDDATIYSNIGAKAFIQTVYTFITKLPVQALGSTDVFFFTNEKNIRMDVADEIYRRIDEEAERRENSLFEKELTDEEIQAIYDEYNIDFRPVKIVEIEGREFIWEDKYTTFVGWEVLSLEELDYANGYSDLSIALNAVWETREPTDLETFGDSVKLTAVTLFYKALDSLGATLEPLLVDFVDQIAARLGYYQ